MSDSGKVAPFRHLSRETLRGILSRYYDEELKLRMKVEELRRKRDSLNPVNDDFSCVRVQNRRYFVCASNGARTHTFLRCSLRSQNLIRSSVQCGKFETCGLV